MSTLELYWPLASNKTSERLQASSDLINLLNKFQQDFKPADEDRDGEESDHSEPSDQEEDTVDKNQKSVIKRIEKWIEKHHAPDVSYAIKRLIRGLASPRESSRLGFAVTLTQVRILSFPRIILFTLLSFSQICLCSPSRMYFRWLSTTLPQLETLKAQKRETSSLVDCLVYRQSSNLVWLADRQRRRMISRKRLEMWQTLVRIRSGWRRLQDGLPLMA